MTALIDIGANLTASSFSQDLSQVIFTAQQQSVSRMIVTGSNLQHSKKAILLCEQYPQVLFSTVGVHPHHADEVSASDAKAILAMTKNTCVVALGECGLDYNRYYSTKKAQLFCFEMQLELATECHLPLFLHQRDAHDDFLKLLNQYRDKLTPAVAHCFTAGKNELAAYLDLDLYIGITGWICDERRGFHLRDLLAMIPENRLMVETDAPYLLPRDLQNKPKSRRNEPKYLPHIVSIIASSLNKDYVTIANQTTANAERFFGLESIT